MLRLPDGRLLIIDTGPLDSPVVEWLAGRNERIYGLVLTHNDEDHAGCFPDVLERFPTRLEHVFLLMDRNPQVTAAKRILGCAYRYAKRGDFTLNDLQAASNGILPIFGSQDGKEKLAIYAVHPDFVAILGNQLRQAPRPNVVSAVVYLDVNEVTHVVWAGDAPMREVADKCEGKNPEVMVGPHHGGPIDRKQVDHPAQYDRVAPRNIFVSAGTGNIHGHPIKGFIDQHRFRKRRVVCSQIVHCDNRRVENRHHVMRQHLQMGMIPPQNTGAVTCRGPMRLMWNDSEQAFVHDEFHGEHLRRLAAVHRPYCLGGLLAGKMD